MISEQEALAAILAAVPPAESESVPLGEAAGRFIARDFHARLPLLSTYLGHVGPSSTYWYLTATPALLELAAQRVEPWGGTHP